MIELKNITKIYDIGTPSEITVLKNFNMNVNTQDFISIVGSNGSGKTTLLNCICGNIRIEDGKIIINGKDVTKLKDSQRYKYIGRVYQNPEVGTCQNMTVLENLALADNKGKKYGLKFCISKKRIEYYKSKLKELGMGLEEKLFTRVGSLSGGQRQAIALIMATLTDVEILILDEHTAALDPKTAEIIMELTNKIIKERNLTALMITHNLKHALTYGNRLVAMNEGNIIMDIPEYEKKNMTQENLLRLFNELEILQI